MVGCDRIIVKSFDRRGASFLQVHAEAGHSKFSKKCSGNSTTENTKKNGTFFIKQRYYILSMGSISNAIRFAKAIICAQSWRKYAAFCK